MSESPWPVFTAIGAFGLTFGMVMYMHGFEGGFGLLELSVCQLIFSVSCWWRDVIRESTIECYHTSKVVVGLKWGMILFITSEVMFFFAFFWSFFYFSFNPSLAVGGVWPPMYLTTLDPFAVPLLNTVLLLTSGVSLTWSHHSIVLGAKGEAVVGLIITLIYATAFSALQYYEYINAPFCMSDGVYGSIFYLTTGFHGFHVFVGSLFLGVCLYRLFADHFTRDRHFGFEAAAWYWHFVDVVWLFLYIVFYLWGSY